MGDEHVGANDAVPADDRAAAQNRGTGVDGHIVFDGGVTLLALEALTATGGKGTQSNALVNLYMVANGGGFADDDTGAVVDEEVLADGSTGVDVEAGDGMGMLRHDSGQHGNAHGVQNVGQTINGDGKQTGNKAGQGHFKKAGVSAKRFVREFKFENASEYALGDEIKADIFAAGDRVDATAISKGKGFQGAIKRHGQHRGPMAHGSKFHRHQGSNGACSSPSRVFKGKGMPGHMGCVKVTVQNLTVVRVDADKNLLLVKGAVPGPKKALVTIKETTRVEA